jgi:hypothetical protein
MNPTSRRAFLSGVGRGMLAAGLGTSLTSDLGFPAAFADDEADSLFLGEYAGLVDLMRSTPAEKLQPKLAQMIAQQQVDLKKLIGAGALANAITFGGCDYVGFHTAMAMLPSLEMSNMLADGRQPLPVLKVLYRNSQQIQSVGGASKATLEAIHAAEHSSEGDAGAEIRDACRKVDVSRGEALLAGTGSAPLDAFNALQPAIQDDVNVHRFVFAHRTYGLARLLGDEYAISMLRQCVRFCVDHERHRIEHQQPESPIRALVPKLIDKYRLEGKALGARDPGDAAVNDLSLAIYNGPNERAAEAVASALADGIDPEVIGEAISLASNLYVLRQGTDNWRTHGDSAGVHSSDATNAWRNMVRISAPRFAASGLIVAAYHAGIQSTPFKSPPYPTEEHRALIKGRDATSLLAETDDAIRHNDQGRAAAAMQIYGENGHALEPALKLMLKYAVSEDGRLHGEKYFHTVREEFHTIRPAFRWRQVVALARVTSSAFGYNREDKHGFRAAGYEDACKLLGVQA